MNITKLRKLWFTISGTMILASILAMIVFKFNLGLDFIGGARWDITFKESTKVSSESLKSFFKSKTEIQKDVKIQESENGRFFITLENLNDQQIQNISKDLKSQIGEFTETSYRKVDANIGASFKIKALYAILAALLGISLFVAFAFRKVPIAINPWRFGTVAIVALFHDVVIIAGVFVCLGALYQVELDLPFVTALLATFGFSINDTIVILDRVRENIRLQKAHETFENTIENSIQQTLLRSLCTSFSILLPLLGLLFLGAESTFYFVLALALGITVGTYSSIFVAAPLLVTWKNWSDARN